MTKWKKYKLDVYEAEFWVCITDDSVGALSSAKCAEKFGNIEPREGSAFAVCSWPIVGVVLPVDCDHNTVAHECTHAALGVYGSIDAKAPRISDEPFCYLCGWLADKVYKSFNKIGVKVK